MTSDESTWVGEYFSVAGDFLCKKASSSFCFWNKRINDSVLMSAALTVFSSCCTLSCAREEGSHKKYQEVVFCLYCGIFLLVFRVKTYHGGIKEILHVNKHWKLNSYTAREYRHNVWSFFGRSWFGCSRTVTPIYIFKEGLTRVSAV